MLHDEAVATDDSARPRTARLSRSQRRSQLLDVTADLLVNHGAQAVTMERIAEWAGVSKALPYAHFANANEVLLALRDRETVRVAEHMWDSCVRTEPSVRADAVVSAYLDAVEHSAPLLGVLTGSGAIVTRPRDSEDRLGPWFIAALLTEFFDLTDDRARTIAPTLLGVLIGAAEGWAAGDSDRETTQALIVGLMQSLVRFAGEPVPERAGMTEEPRDGTG